MASCKACDTTLGPATAASTGDLCAPCDAKQLSCRVCGQDFFYRDILGDLPIVQCPSCEGRAVDVVE